MPFQVQLRRIMSLGASRGSSTCCSVSAQVSNPACPRAVWVCGSAVGRLLLHARKSSERLEKHDKRSHGGKDLPPARTHLMLDPVDPEKKVAEPVLGRIPLRSVALDQPARSELGLMLTICLRAGTVSSRNNDRPTC